MSGPAFGFSAGDFISAVSFLVKVTKALKDAGGATDEYRSLVAELGLLQCILRQLHMRQGPDNIFAPDVKQQTNLTLATLSSFLKTISKFDSKLGENAHSSWHHGAAKKAQWATMYAKEVEQLRVKVGTHLAELNLLLQLQTSTEADELGTKVDDIAVVLRSQENQLVCWRQESSKSIESLSTQIKDLNVCQETKLQVTNDSIQDTSNRVEVLKSTIESQTRQISALREDTQDSNKALTASVRETSEVTQQRLDMVSTKSDQILEAIVETRQDITRSIQNLQQTSLVPYEGQKRQIIRFDERDEILVLIFQLLTALSKSMGDLLTKAGFLVPYLFAAMQTMTTTIRREPFLIVQDSINLVDLLGRKYTLQYDYFRDWPTFHAFLCKQFHNCPWEGFIKEQCFQILRTDKTFGTSFCNPPMWRWAARPGEQFRMCLCLRSDRDHERGEYPKGYSEMKTNGKTIESRTIGAYTLTITSKIVFDRIRGNGGGMELGEEA